MRKLLFIFLFSLVAIAINAQTTQKGVVQEYNEKAKKTPLSGVELRAKSAQNAVSGKDGSFQLEFLTLKPGDRVNISRIEKLGYEIFNKEAVEQWNLNPKTPFVIVMCRSDKFKKIRDNYEAKASENYNRQYKKEIAKLEKLKAEGRIKDEEYRKSLQEIQETYDKQIENLNTYIDRFSRIDLSEISAAEQEIIELVQQGKFDEAIAEYEKINPLNFWIKLNNQKVGLESAIKTLEDKKESVLRSQDSALVMTNRHIKTLMLSGDIENIKKAIDISCLLADSDTTNLESQFKAGELIAGYTKDYGIARKYFQTALNHILKTKGHKHPDISTAYRNIASTYDMQGDFNNALVYYNKAWLMAQKLFGEESLEVATIVNGIGIVHSNKGDFPKAMELYNLALNIRKNYLEPNHPLIGQSYNNIGSAYHYSGEYGKALEYYLKALQIQEDTSRRNDPDIATSYNNIGAAYLGCGDIENALNYSFKGLDKRKNIFGDESCAVAASNNNIGLIFLQKKDFNKAMEYFMKGLSIREKILGERHPNVAQSYNNVATVLLWQGESDRALEYYQKALTIYEKTIGLNNPDAISTSRDIQYILDMKKKHKAED